MKFRWSVWLLFLGLSFLGESTQAQQSKAVNASVRSVAEKQESLDSDARRQFHIIGRTNYFHALPSKKVTKIHNLYSPPLRINPMEYAGTYWQAGCGSWTVGRIHQGSRAFFTAGAGWSFPRCSFQKGVLKSKALVHSGISINGTAGGLFLPVVNKSFASYTSKGFNYFVKDGLRTESIGKGSPQLGLGLSLTIRTK